MSHVLRMALLFLIGCSIGMIPLSALAEIPENINYQGLLVDSTGKPVPDGDYAITFSIYDSTQATKPLWSETQTPINVSTGIFSTKLPADNRTLFPKDLFENGRYLGISVGKDAEMTPRQPLTSTPFSFIAQNSDKIEGQTLSGLDARYVNTGEEETIDSSMILDGSITGDDLAETYLSAAHLPSNQPFQYNNSSSYDLDETSSLSIGASSELVPAGKRLIIQHLSFNISSKGFEAEPLCDVDVLHEDASGHLSWVVTHTLQPFRYERAFSRVSYISSQPITLYVDPSSKVQVGCSVLVNDYTSIDMALTGYYVDI